MSSNLGSELANFQQFITDHLRADDTLTPEEALDLWRAQYPCPSEFTETVVALNEALAELKAGHAGTSFHEFEETFRKKHGLHPR